MSFTEYLQKAKDDQNASGDFARDWLADRSNDKPRPSKNFGPIERFLVSKGASSECLTAGRAAWRQWQEREKASEAPKPSAIT
jgi:hypothetical protein